MMDTARTFLKIVLWVLAVGFGCNSVLQAISYSFYKKAAPVTEAAFMPLPLQLGERLSGYGCQLDADSPSMVLFFGGSGYTAYNAAASFGGLFPGPFLSADYYGSQNSPGRMNLSTMQATAVELYDWAVAQYPDKQVVVMGHSYGTGMAAYLASQRPCRALVLLSAYRTTADLYNKIIPIFWGPAQVFISNNIRLDRYARDVDCDTYIIGSSGDKILPAALQEKVKTCFSNAHLQIFADIPHNGYLQDPQVLAYIRTQVLETAPPAAAP